MKYVIKRIDVPELPGCPYLVKSGGWGRLKDASRFDSYRDAANYIARSTFNLGEDHVRIRAVRTRKVRFESVGFANIYRRAPSTESALSVLHRTKELALASAIPPWDPEMIEVFRKVPA